MSNVVKTICLVFVVLLGLQSFAHAEKEIRINPKMEKDDPKYVEFLVQGKQALHQKKPKVAIKDYFNPIIKHCSTLQENTEKRVYSARSLEETLFYLLKDIADNNKNETQSSGAIVYGPLCAEAHYLLGYALIELKMIEDGAVYTKKAHNLSPLNSLYLSALGHIYQTEKKWQQAMETFSKAEEYANDFSPESKKKFELLRAKRGVGFSLIELGKLDEAEEKFGECLEIDKNDRTALGELKYINQLRQKAKQ